MPRLLAWLPQVKAAELASVIDKHAGDKLPAVKAAVAAGVAKAQAVLQSEQVSCSGHLYVLLLWLQHGRLCSVSLL